MTDAEKYVAVFRAAASGVMKPYQQQVTLPDGSVGITMGERQSNDTGYYHAQSMAGAFNAIANVFQGIVDAGGE